MLSSPEKVEEQLNGPVDASVREAYLTFAHARLPAGMTVRPTGHGYISRELRFEDANGWHYSAVLNKKWVLWYFRRPAIAADIVQEALTMARFPGAETTTRGEIKLRVFDAAQAREVLDWIGAAPTT